MKDLMMDAEVNKMYAIDVILEKFYFDDDNGGSGSYDESSDTYKLLVEQLNRMKQKVRGWQSGQWRRQELKGFIVL